MAAEVLSASTTKQSLHKEKRWLFIQQVPSSYDIAILKSECH